MYNQEYHARFIIKDIETKVDRNFNHYYLLHFANSNYQHGYAFPNSAEKNTLDILNEAPEKFVNRWVNITYSLTQTFNRSFLQIKSITLIN